MTIGSHARTTNNVRPKSREPGTEIFVNSQVQNVDVVIAKQPACQNLKMIGRRHRKNLGWNIKRTHRWLYQQNFHQTFSLILLLGPDPTDMAPNCHDI